MILLKSEQCYNISSFTYCHVLRFSINIEIFASYYYFIITRLHTYYYCTTKLGEISKKKTVKSNEIKIITLIQKENNFF